MKVLNCRYRHRLSGKNRHIQSSNNHFIHHTHTHTLMCMPLGNKKEKSAVISVWICAFLHHAHAQYAMNIEEHIHFITVNAVRCKINTEYKTTQKYSMLLLFCLGSLANYIIHIDIEKSCLMPSKNKSLNIDPSMFCSRILLLSIHNYFRNGSSG